jgi:general stress protein YciG
MTDVKDRMMMSGDRKERRGFASMSPEKQREIASKGRSVAGVVDGSSSPTQEPRRS